MRELPSLLLKNITMQMATNPAAFGVKCEVIKGLKSDTSCTHVSH
jgi:hypothetical protein